MQKLGLDGTIKLIAYPNKSIRDDGLGTIETPTEYNIRAVIVPFAAYRFGRVFGEMLQREGRGEYFNGENILFVDDKWLKDNNIVIDTELDRIEYNGNQYKLMRYGGFKHYHNVSMYLCQRIAETYEE